MSALDSWVTEYKATECGAPAYHIYRCLERHRFDPDVMYVGAEVPVDHQTYKICGIDATEAGDGTWMLIYAHLVPQKMTESEWHGLYGDPELASRG